MRKAEVRTSRLATKVVWPNMSNPLRDIMCAGLYIKSALFSLKNKEVKIIAKKDLFINDEIRVREVRLVGLDGEQLGIKPLSEAQAIADDANVDLVLIQPQATPPVAKIMDYGKFKFEYQKKQKETT